MRQLCCFEPQETLTYKAELMPLSAQRMSEEARVIAAAIIYNDNSTNNNSTNNNHMLMIITII